MTIETPRKSRDRWLCIDGTNCVHRDFYGMGNDPVRLADNFERRLTEMLERWKPVAVVSAWDCGPSFRNNLYAPYKAGRKRVEGIAECIAAVKLRCITMGIGRIEVAGFEADDILATLARHATSEGCQCVIYSNDKDLHQVIQEEHVLQLTKVQRVKREGNVNHLEFTFCTARDLWVQYQVTPNQWVDYKCIVGDPSDNIPGVHSIGPQTAGRLLVACGSIDGFYQAPFKAAISDKQRAVLMNAKKQMPLFKQLCELRRDVPLPQFWREGC